MGAEGKFEKKKNNTPCNAESQKHSYISLSLLNFSSVLWLKNNPCNSLFPLN